MRRRPPPDRRASSSSAPSSSRSRKRPVRVSRSSRTRIASPTPLARASQAARTGAKPSSRQRSRPAGRNAGRTLPAAAAGVTAGKPCSASEVAGYSTSLGRRREVDAGADHDEIDPLARAGLRFEQDAGELAAVGQQVVRPFVARAAAPARSAPSARSPRPSAATKPSCAARAGGPAGPLHQRQIEIARRRQPSRGRAGRARRSARRPRPACLRRRRRGRSAWPRHWCCRSIGEMQQPVAVGQRRRSLGHRANSEAAAASAPPTIGSGHRMKNIVRQHGDEQHALQLRRDRPVEGDQRLVEIHDLDDAQIIEGADHAGDDADHREPDQMRVDRREEDVELARRNPAVGGIPASANMKMPAPAPAPAGCGRARTGRRCPRPSGPAGACTG